MKITHNKVGQNLNTSDAQAAKTSQTSAANSSKKTGQAEAAQTNSAQGSQAAKVELSSRAQDIKKIKELAMNSPDVDANKVEKFKRMIAEGTYKVDAKAVADRMVDEHLQGSGKASTE